MTTTETTTKATAEAALDAAMVLARGHYQRDIILGRARLSGAGLRGTAKRWGAVYARSRAHLLARLDAAQVAYSEVALPPSGRRELVWGHAAMRVADIGRATARRLEARGTPVPGLLWRVGLAACAVERASWRGEETAARALAALAIRGLREVERAR